MAQTLDLLECADLADRHTGGFAKGMRQRIGLAQAILHHPHVLFLAEPTSGLDPMGVKLLRDIVARLNAEFGMTIFMNTHLLSEISLTCTSIGVLSHRRLDASRDRFVLLVTLFLTAAAIVSLVTGAIALATDVATYDAGRATLLALGKPADAIAAPEFYPMRLLRGAIEQAGIIGVAIVMGYRAAAAERGRQTLALIMTRPVHRWQFVAGKALAGLTLLAGGHFVVLTLGAVVLLFVSGVSLGAGDLVRIGLVWVLAVANTACFFLTAFILTLWMKRPPHALLAAFSLWLILVLIAPRIGDTLDPDNQVAGGDFAQLHIAKPDQIEILKGFATFETVRTGIEAASITKHFERFACAVLGVKDTYAGVPLGTVVGEKWGVALFVLCAFLGFGGILAVLPIRSDRLIKE